MLHPRHPYMISGFHHAVYEVYDFIRGYTLVQPLPSRPASSSATASVTRMDAECDKYERHTVLLAAAYARLQQKVFSQMSTVYNNV